MHFHVAVIAFAAFCAAFPQTEAWRQEFIRGSFAEAGQFPWHVVILKQPFAEAICSGSLISEVFVLSAAKCLKRIDEIHLRFGSLTLFDPNAVTMISREFYEDQESTAILIRLPNSIKFTNEIQKIGLPPVGFSVSGKTLTVSGYGLVWRPRPEIAEQQKSYRLKYGNIYDTEEQERCSGHNGRFKMCARATRNRYGMCGGERGSAVRSTNNQGQPIQVAIQREHSSLCGHAESTLSYILVEPLLSWISEVTGLPFL